MPRLCRQSKKRRSSASSLLQKPKLKGRKLSGMNDTNTNPKDYGTDAYSGDLAEDAGREDESEDALEENPDDDELGQLDELDDEPE